MSIEDLVGDRQAFRTEYFRRTPLLRRGSAGERFGDWLSARELLDEIVALETLPLAYLRLVENGKQVSRAAYTTKVITPRGALSEAVSPSRVREQFDRGATVVCNYLNHFLPAMRRLTHMFEEVFRCQSEAAAFLTPPQSTGLAPHTDPVDIFVIHLEGSKDWKIWDRTSTSDADPLSRLGKPILTTTLYPGDVLYMPAECPHVAVSSGTTALHISLSLEPRRWRDLLREVVAALTADERYHAVADLGSADREIATFAEKVRVLREQLADLDPSIELKRMATTVPGSPR